MQAVYNWHITEHCNYACHYCFAKWGKPDEIWKDLEKVRGLLNEIRFHGRIPFGRESEEHQVRLNFAGGEPMLLGQKLYEINQLAREYQFNTSLITNASLLERHVSLVKHLDMIGISIDSLSQGTNALIGRTSNSKETLSYEKLSSIIDKIRAINPSILIKFNIVVNQFNFEERLVPRLERLMPHKIKIFQELSGGPNKTKTTRAMFDIFLQKNRGAEPLFVEDNHAMRGSYLMIDPHGRLYQNSDSQSYIYSPPIYEVGLKNALNNIEFNKQKFRDRYYAN